MAEALIATVAGEFAPSFLTKEATKVGIKQFIQTYGSTAFRTVAPVITGGMIAEKVIEAYPPVDLQKEKLFGVPLNRITGQGEVYSDIEEPKKVEPLKYIDTVHGGKGPLEPIKAKGFPAETEVKKWDESFKAPEKIETNKGFEVPLQEKVVPPGFETPDIVDTSILTKDITKQTKDLVTKEPEFGALTRAEKKTARLEKGDKPDFYSRAIEAITNAKQDTYTKGKWKSIVKGNTTKDEMDYLGLTELLEGKESISKQELLKLVKDKDIASGMTVKSIPKDQMNPMYEGYSLGGNQEHIVFQIGFNPAEDDKSVQYREPHFADYSPQYAEDTFAHARVQVGFDKGFSAKYDDLSSEVIDKLKNTQIVDEVQSQWIQTGQDKGFVSDFSTVNDTEKELTEFLNKNNIKYKIQPGDKSKSTVDTIKIYDKPDHPNERKRYSIATLNQDAWHVFNKKGRYVESYDISAPEEDRARTLVLSERAVPDFPIKDSKKFVELVLNEMIRKAVKDGRDSIAITNGQIQYNRYEAMEEKERQGLKKFYDTFVYDQLNKIAKNYGVELERITIEEFNEVNELQDQLQFPTKVKTAQTAGHTLQILTGEHLDELVNNVDLPGHSSIYTNEGRGQGADYILNLLNNKKQLAEKYYVWTKEKISEDINDMVLEDFKKINFDIPFVNVKDTLTNEAVKGLLNASTEEREYILKQFTRNEAGYPYEGDNINNTDLIQYTEYLKNYKPPEGIDLGYEQDAEQLIKMKLPKKLQKKKLSESQRLTKVEQQTQRMFG